MLRASMVMILVVAACRPESAPADTESEATVEAAATDTAITVSPPSPALPVSIQREISFAHDPHRDIDCRRCHENIPGHASHVTVACAECHLLPGEARTRATAPAECNACHHGPRQTLDCLHCHGSAPEGERVLSVPIRTSVRPAATPRDLRFDHARHASLQCASCHVDRPAVASPRTCADCHAEHHREGATCSLCHTPFPLDTHDIGVHRGCGGAGCHEDGSIENLSGREFCLVCHRAQQDHEPGGDCARCHLMRTDTARRAARP